MEAPVKPWGKVTVVGSLVLLIFVGSLPSSPPAFEPQHRTLAFSVLPGPMSTTAHAWSGPSATAIA